MYAVRPMKRKFATIAITVITLLSRTCNGRSTVLSCLTWRRSTRTRRETGWTMTIRTISLTKIFETYQTTFDRLDDALDSYNQIRQSLAETQVIFLQTLENQCSSTSSKAKAETLCVCWNKLDQDVSELTKAITSGGASKVNRLQQGFQFVWFVIVQVTMENLEESIRTLKEMFIERKPMIEVCDIFEVSFNFVW